MKKLRNMKLVLIYLVTYLASMNLEAQKIESVEIDKFTGKKRIGTDYILLKSGFSQVAQIGFRSVDTTVFVTIKGTWAVGTVGPQDAAVFLMNDKSTFNIYPTSIQSYDIGYGQYSQNSYSHQYIINKSDLGKLASIDIVSVRRNYSSYYADTDVKAKNAKKIKELAQLLLNEMNNGK